MNRVLGPILLYLSYGARKTILVILLAPLLEPYKLEA